MLNVEHHINYSKENSPDILKTIQADTMAVRYWLRKLVTLISTFQTSTCFPSIVCRFQYEERYLHPVA